MKQRYQADLNGYAIGIIMQELVRRAIVIIRNERKCFVPEKKVGYSGLMDDVFTSADTKAQEVYIKELRECFPDFGIVAEEAALSIKSQDGCLAYFTVDPLDGTKAFIRRQSHGVGTMIALVEGGEVIAAYVGDVNTQEIYGYHPRSDHVHRITYFDVHEPLDQYVGTKGQLGTGYVLLRDRKSAYFNLSQQTMRKHFKSYEISSGSIGTWMSRLWKGEVEGVLMPPEWETPWDSSPVVGISKKLGFVFLRPTQSMPTFGWEEYEPLLIPKKYRRDYDTFIVHRNYLKFL